MGSLKHQDEKASELLSVVFLNDLKPHSSRGAASRPHSEGQPTPIIPSQAITLPGTPSGQSAANLSPFPRGVLLVILGIMPPLPSPVCRLSPLGPAVHLPRSPSR